MAIEYLGLSEINGPLVVLEGVKNASFEEIVEFHMDDGTQKIGRIIEIYEDKAVIQVFEGTDNMSLGNTHTRLTGHPMEIGLSPRLYWMSIVILWKNICSRDCLKNRWNICREISTHSFFRRRSKQI